MLDNPVYKERYGLTFKFVEAYRDKFTQTFITDAAKPKKAGAAEAEEFDYSRKKVTYVDD